MFFFGYAKWHVGSYFPVQGSNMHWKLRVYTTGPLSGKSLFLNTFDPQLAESTDVEPAHKGGLTVLNLFFIILISEEQFVWT